MTTRYRRAKRLRNRLVSSIPWLFFLIGLGVFLIFGYFAHRSWSSTHWPHALATILRTETKESTHSHGRHRHPKTYRTYHVVYTYSVEG